MKLGKVGRNKPKPRLGMVRDMPGVHKILMVRMFTENLETGMGTDELANVRNVEFLETETQINVVK